MQPRIYRKILHRRLVSLYSYITNKSKHNTGYHKDFIHIPQILGVTPIVQVQKCIKRQYTGLVLNEAIDYALNNTIRQRKNHHVHVRTYESLFVCLFVRGLSFHSKIIY